MCNGDAEAEAEAPATGANRLTLELLAVLSDRSTVDPEDDECRLLSNDKKPYEKKTQ